MASKSIALVHGGFVDGSGWEAVYRSLRKLYRCICSGQRGIGVQPNQGSAAGRAGASDSAATGRLSISRQGRSSVLRLRPMWKRKKQSSWPPPKSRRGSRRLMAQSANQLGRPSRAGTWSPPTTDSTARAASYVQACRRNGRGGLRQSRSICLPA